MFILGVERWPVFARLVETREGLSITAVLNDLIAAGGSSGGGDVMAVAMAGTVVMVMTVMTFFDRCLKRMSQVVFRLAVGRHKCLNCAIIC